MHHLTRTGYRDLTLGPDHLAALVERIVSTWSGRPEDSQTIWLLPDGGFR